MFLCYYQATVGTGKLLIITKAPSARGIVVSLRPQSRHSEAQSKTRIMAFKAYYRQGSYVLMFHVYINYVIITLYDLTYTYT